MKKLITALVAFSFVMLGVSAVDAGVRADLNRLDQGISISEGAIFGERPPALFGFDGGTTDPYLTFCESLEDKACLEANSMTLWSHLSPCSLGSATNCIDSFYAEDETGKRIQGEFVRYVNEDSKWAFDERASNNFPKTRGMGGVWRLSGLTDATTDLYYVSTFASFGVGKIAGSPAWGYQKSPAHKFQQKNSRGGNLNLEYHQ